MKSILGAALLAVVVAAPAAAQDDTWSWRKAVPAGQTVEVRGILGTISATAASGNEVEIVARKTARRGDPAESGGFGIAEFVRGRRRACIRLHFGACRYR